MTHAVTNLAPVVNLEKYPVSELDGPAGQALVDEARASFNDTSLVVLDDFLRPEAVRQVAKRSLKDAESLGFRFTGSNDVFLGTGEPDAPVHTQVGREHTKTTLAYDRIDESSPLKALFCSEPVLAFVRRVVGGPVYRSADPLGAMTVHVHHDGDEQDWHFDVSQYTIVLHILAPESGGVLEYVPRSRAQAEQDQAALRAIAGGERHPLVHGLPTVPGTLVLHSGRISMHRVTPVEGATPRISATMSYNSAPDGQLNEYTRSLYFGRRW
ncbi:2OG-Fe(II) oxygenase [Streptomyces sp. B-S-A8]|uniref:2OG-Fe(II) oxygenase n=1 Tax=Streptomyces solicavernae TaxID=3043614 RepID=A0ABT6S0M4_9ACTN|nr:2OG-Fe(II) oxygenase [Streptomyces sp. B-S-A8]MDI3389528.1 2OG-Fe(II) oxygenase [Streptomyces sp. B-S-A8]